MIRFEKEQATLMRYRLTAVWLGGALLLGIGLRGLSAIYPDVSVALSVLACAGLLMLAFGYSAVKVLRDEAIQLRDRNQLVLDSHESMNTPLFGYGHVKLVPPDDTA